MLLCTYTEEAECYCLVAGLQDRRPATRSAKKLWVCSWHSDAVNPVRNAAALGTDITQDGPDSHCSQDNCDRQNNNKLWNFGCFLIEQHKQAPFPRTLSGGFEKWAGTPPSRSDRGLETAANRHPGEGFQDAVNKRVKQQDNNWTKEKRHSQ